MITSISFRLFCKKASYLPATARLPCGLNSEEKILAFWSVETTLQPVRLASRLISVALNCVCRVLKFGNA